jgi:hypothetical protein
MNVNVTLKTSLNQNCKKSLQQILILNNNIVQVQKWNTIQLVYNLYTCTIHNHDPKNMQNSNKFHIFLSLHRGWLVHEHEA